MKRMIYFTLALLALPFGLRAQSPNDTAQILNDTAQSSFKAYEPRTHDTTGWEYEYTRMWQSELCPEYWYCLVDSTPIVVPRQRQTYANSYSIIGKKTPCNIHVSKDKRYFALDSAEYAALRELIAWWKAGAKVESYFWKDCYFMDKIGYRAKKEKP